MLPTSFLHSIAAQSPWRWPQTLSLSLAGCGKTETGMSTADRVKLVEEKQKNDPNYHLPKKAADTAKAEQVKAATTSARAAPPKDSTAMRQGTHISVTLILRQAKDRVRCAYQERYGARKISAFV